MNDPKKPFFRRMPAYFGGLFISLAAMVGIFQVKRALMPKFHPLAESHAEFFVKPGGGVRLLYNDEPGHFLIPGLPTGAVVSQKQADGTFAPLLRFSYGDLVEKAPLIGPLKDEGEYKVEATLYVCARPGVADCTKWTFSQNGIVRLNAPTGESHVEVDLPKLGQFGLEAAGKIDAP